MTIAKADVQYILQPQSVDHKGYPSSPVVTWEEGKVAVSFDHWSSSQLTIHLLHMA